MESHDLESLDRAKRTRTIAPGMNLYHQGDQADGIYCIQSGLIGLRRIDENGNSSLLKTSPAGTTTGYQAFLSKEPYSNSAEALVPSEVCFIDSSAVTKLLSDNPNLGERFLQHTFEDLKELEDSYSRSLTLNVKSRFLHLMMVYYRQFGFLDSAGYPSVDIPVTRTDLSELLGIQPESLSRIIKKVQGEGLVQINDRRVVITNIEDVLSEAGVTV